MKKPLAIAEQNLATATTALRAATTQVKSATERVKSAQACAYAKLKKLSLAQREWQQCRLILDRAREADLQGTV